GDGGEAIAYLKGMGAYEDRKLYPLPQLLMLDLHMPRVDGFHVLEWLRHEPIMDHLLVVVFSSSNKAADMRRAQELGAHWYLVKPHSMGELMELVGRFKKYWLEAPNDEPRKAA